MTKGEIAQKLLDLGRAVTSTIGLPGAANVLKVGSGVVELVNQSLDIFTERDQAKLRAMRDALARKVSTHADKTADSLEG